VSLEVDGSAFVESRAESIDPMITRTRPSESLTGPTNASKKQRRRLDKASSRRRMAANLRRQATQVWKRQADYVMARDAKTDL